MTEEATGIEERVATAEPSAPASAAVSVPAEPAEPAAPAEPDSFDALLAEYDRQVAQLPSDTTIEDIPADFGGQQPAAPPFSAEQSIADTLSAQRELWELQQNGQQAARHIEALERSVAEMQHRQWVQAEAADLNKIVDASVAEMRNSFPDLPEAFIRAWWDAKPYDDPVAVKLFDNRRQSPKAAIAWRNYEDRMKRELHAMAASRPDMALTEDRNAVAAAVRGASRSEIPTEPPPKVSTMTDSEFRAYTRQQYGFEGV